MELKLLVFINLQTHLDYLGFLSQFELAGSSIMLLQIKTRQQVQK